MRRWIALSLTGYCLFIAFVVLSPSADLPSSVVSHLGALLDRAGAPAGATVGYRLEFALNALMVVPIAAGGHVLVPSSGWRDWTAWSFVASGSVELVQGLLLPHRSASFVDVCANTSGGLLGVLVVSCGALVVRERSAHAAQSAP